MKRFSEGQNMTESWGPFVAIGDIDPAERVARLRALRAIAMGVCRKELKLIDALRGAETDYALLDVASTEFDRLPALAKRRLWACYADLGDQR
jgi:hypothetical protein